MILSQISWLDITVFLLFLVPQLLINVNILTLLQVLIKSLPFFFFELPRYLIQERLFHSKLAFSRNATFFEDLVIRVVRYAFTEMPYEVGRVFFSKHVSMPFLRFRLLRHGYWQPPFQWQEVQCTSSDTATSCSALYAAKYMKKPPSLLIYYVHGGGFVMGSPHFYLEGLLTLISLLEDQSNPAVLALDYSLVPEEVYPVQRDEALAGYVKALKLVNGDSSKICIAGDSAGAAILMDMLVRLGDSSEQRKNRSIAPQYAAFISPWVTTLTDDYKVSPSDFLEPETLKRYARMYLPHLSNTNTDSNTLHAKIMRGHGDQISKDEWSKILPEKGLCMHYGTEEVLKPEIEKLGMSWKTMGFRITMLPDKSQVHASAVARVFLASDRVQRLKGLKAIADAICTNMPAG